MRPGVEMVASANVVQEHGHHVDRSRSWRPQRAALAVKPRDVELDNPIAPGITSAAAS